MVGASFIWSMIGGAPGDTLWDAYSGHRSLTDSPNGEYSNNRNIAAEINPTFNLTGRQRRAALPPSLRDRAGLRLLHRRVQEERGRLDAARLLQRHSGCAANYLPVTLPLTAALGGQCKLRFRFTSDVSVTDDGWHLDDLEVYVDEAASSSTTSRRGLETYAAGAVGPRGAADSAGARHHRSGRALHRRRQDRHRLRDRGRDRRDLDTIDVRIVPPDWVAGP
ncbi:MAG: hypothetical protein U0527_02625 [Candidatus Eisenbacteria bacterium]